jgi:hypothetical protein
MFSVALSALLPFVLVAHAAAAPAGGDRWTVTTTVNPSAQANYFDSIRAFASGDVWAVGAWYRPDTSTPATLTEHWNGSAWKLVTSPNATEGYNELQAVDGVGSKDVWAVGYANIAQYGSERTLALHWNGRSWKIVSTPNLGTTANILSGLTTIASNDAWAVGFGNDPGGFAGHATALHWNGTKWRLSDVAPPSAHGSELTAVDAIANDDIWAVGWQDGATLTEHFDGSTWSVVPSPNGDAGDGSLFAVKAIAPNDVWAAGSTGSSNGREADEATLLMHWDGSTWTIVDSPNGSNSENVIEGLTAFGTANVWAVGSSYQGVGVDSRTLVERWDGSSWRLVNSPNPDPNYDGFTAVGGAGAKQTWAVGGTTRLALAMHR